MLPSLATFCVAISLILPVSTQPQPPPRLRRQLEFNASVPYIFSARLYPFGSDRGDLLVQRDVEPYALEHPVTFLGEKYSTVYIRRDGSIGFRDSPSPSVGLPSVDPTIAVFWAAANATRVLYRETDDVDIVNLAHNEVNIQYRYGARFRVRSVVIITWEQEGHNGLFQLALIVGDDITFAHFVYSRLSQGSPAFAGFSSGNFSFSLPDSGTSEAFLIGERSDIGIPGEWLFQVDGPQIFLCGAGFRGLECVESCLPSQWSNDCHRSCHCDGGDPCDQETGRCPSATCSPGWTGPACEDDIDECLGDAACPLEQPDCVNTAGAFLCLCFDYDDEKKTCRGAPAPKEVFAVPDISLQPSIGRLVPPTTTRTPPPRRFSLTTPHTTRKDTTTTTTSSPVVHAVQVLKVFKEEQGCSGCHERAECVGSQCKCLPGFEGDGKRCNDVDECATNSCGENAVCTNTPGSFDCDCNDGFISIGGKCTDVDECANAPCGLSEGVLCVNELGSFRCDCKDGFDKHNNCRDIDECAVPGACGPNAKCANTPGAFECECMAGFERLFEGANCTDINECVVEPCHPAARCVNEPGSFDCHCIDGFVGDGLECHETMMYPIANDSVVVPRAAEASAALALAQPILFFGKKYNTIFVSSNGVISFDGPVKGLIETPSRAGRSAVFVLHAQMDYAREGLVAYTFVNESDEAAYAVLTRAAVAAETQFGLTNFRPQHLHVFTFDRVRQAGSGNLNSFQAVFACSDNATLLTLVYDKLEAKGALAGVSFASNFNELPSELLASQSNVGRPGRWMMRVDGVLEACPPGRTRAPLCDQDCTAGRWGFGCRSTCHCAGSLPCDPITGRCASSKCAAGWTGPICDQDVDECATGLVICDPSTECINIQGGYECRCRTGFIRNGTRCDVIDPCLRRFGRACSPSATCIEKNGKGTSCVCKTGFKGDGFQCEAKDTLPIIDIAKEILVPSLEGLPAVDEDVAKEVGDTPFVMQTWIPAQTPPPTRRTPLLITAPPPVTETTKTQGNISVTTEEPEPLSSLSIVFVLPAILCLLWIILVVVLTAMWKRRKNSQRENSFVGVWKTPTRNTTSTRRGETPQVIYGRRY